MTTPTNETPPDSGRLPDAALLCCTCRHWTRDDEIMHRLQINFSVGKCALGRMVSHGVTRGHDTCEQHNVPALVYRVQDSDGRGPWKPGFSQVWFTDRTEEEYSALAPWPLEIMLKLRASARGRHIGYACETLEQLRRWITAPEYKTLQSHGYRAVKLEVDAVLARSDMQCVFVRSKPLRIGGEEINLHPNT